MKSPLKNLKKYFQLIMTALICFVMGVIEDKKRICIKDTDSKKDRTVLRPDDKKNNRKNKIIYCTLCWVICRLLLSSAIIAHACKSCLLCTGYDQRWLVIWRLVL